MTIVRQIDSMSLMVASVLLSIVVLGLTNCNGGRARRPEIEMTEVISALKDDSRTEFCIVGRAKDEKQVYLSKVSPFEELYARGRFWVQFSAGNNRSSEFYDTPEEAMKALTDRGVVEFRTCPEPAPL